MKYLITGGAGFLGSHFCDYLLAKGDEVWCLDDLSTGDKANIEEASQNERFHFIEHDITHPLDPGVDFDYILHLASAASPVDYKREPIHTMLTGSQGTLHCLQLARKYDARFFLASTSEIYGDPLIHPQNEEYFGNVNPIGERSVYDEAKRYAEAMTACFNRDFGVETRIVRIFNTYGPRMQIADGRVVPNFICQALRGEELTVYGEGHQTRSFCYFSDLIEGMYRLVQGPTSEPINIGNPGEFTIIEFAELVIEITGSPSKITYKPLPDRDDPKRRKPDISKAKQILDWEPQVTLRQGLEKTIPYFKAKLGL